MRSTPRTDTTDSRKMIEQLSPWFHNLHLPDGAQTAPDHWLGDFPRHKWEQFAPFLPPDMAGWQALDIGCNAGFYSFELARRGATVLGVDHDAHYLEQARWACEQYGLTSQVQFRQTSVYDLAGWDQQYDLVVFAGVFYHLRYPLLGLDIVSRLVKHLMIFQTFTTGQSAVTSAPPDFSFHDRSLLEEPGWPKLAFIENRMEGDPTNWWAPNHACVEALLRSANLRVAARPAAELYICEPGSADRPEPLLEMEFRAAAGLDRLSC